MVVSEVVSEQVTQRSPLEVWWYGSECVFVGMKTGREGKGGGFDCGSPERERRGGGRSRPPWGRRGGAEGPKVGETFNPREQAVDVTSYS